VRKVSTEDIKELDVHEDREDLKVEQMFSGIAARYDLLNHVLSLCLDFKWRKKVATETGRVHCHRILDVCTGTGDMAIELCKFWQGNAHIDAVDFSHELIKIGQEKIKKSGLSDKITFREANAEQLPYKDEQFDAITITFGLRNINNRRKALKEFYRITKPGGCLVCLEFSQPVRPVFNKLYSFYLMKIMPLVSVTFGSNPEAYRYLGRTIKDFLPPLRLVSLIESAGWENVTHYILTGGIVAIHRGSKI
jgi:demethylmenaquinone methyltransferase/2-methoxy-6-polyprenyl-1,4-benzoquinol methylase